MKMVNSSKFILENFLNLISRSTRSSIAQIAIQFIVELGILQSDFAGDSKVVYKAIIAGDPPLLVISHIVKDIASIASFLGTHSFSHTRRQDNYIL